MKSIPVSLTSLEKVKDFVQDMTKIEGGTFLLGGRYVVDAKSIMGIFSLDLSKPLTLEIEDWKEEYGKIIKKYTK